MLDNILMLMPLLIAGTVTAIGMSIIWEKGVADMTTVLTGSTWKRKGTERIVVVTYSMGDKVEYQYMGDYKVCSKKIFLRSFDEVVT